MNKPNVSQNYNARLKLASTYLAIIMCMSLIFSFIIYDISDRELTGQRQIPIPGNSRFLLQDEFEQLRNLRLEQSREILRQKLITFNIVTLILGGVLSYVLARRALLPIEEAFEAQSRFTSDASHEIRTPLTVMKTEIETTLRDKNLKLSDAKQALSSSLEEVIKLENLTTGLLQLANHENTQLDASSVSIKDLISEASKTLKPKFSAKKLKLNTGEVTKLSVQADRASLLQVIIILLDNAIKYSPTNSEIKVDAAVLKNSIHISVQDNGPGISKADMPYIFERFYRADKARSSGDGYGLGLPIAKQIVTAHGGEIKINSTPGAGTTATILLPKK